MRLRRGSDMSFEVASGGISPKWLSMERVMKDHPGRIVELARMPPGITAITDMKLWSREMLDKWITHILRGQRDPDYLPHRFQFREIPSVVGSVPRVVRQYETTKSPSSKLAYTPLEKLYGERVLGESEAAAQGITTSNWEPLPKARTTHIYPTYTAEAFKALREIHVDEAEMCELIEAVARMEHYGPLHVCTFHSTR